jgi:dTDP-4-dehydrorhamnose 3,5-epimerase
MKITPLSIPDVMILEPERFSDQRGFFSETYNRRALAHCGIELEFVQDSHSMSRPKGTIRGLHYQSPPFAQNKLVRVVRGSILDVAVDLRQGSPSYGRHVAAVISAEAWNQILVPIGFAHGFCTLEADTEIVYKVTNYYSPEHDRGILWSDADLGIEWPVADETAVLSPKDRALPRFSAIVSPFVHAASHQGPGSDRVPALLKRLSC